MPGHSFPPVHSVECFCCAFLCIVMLSIYMFGAYYVNVCRFVASSTCVQVSEQVSSNSYFVVFSCVFCVGVRPSSCTLQMA